MNLITGQGKPKENMTKTRTKNIKKTNRCDMYSLYFLAKQVITVKGSRHLFINPREADRFILFCSS